MKRQSERGEPSPGRAKRARERREEAGGTHHKSSGRRERPNQAGASSSSSSSSRRPRDPPPRPLLPPTPAETSGLEYKTLLISNLGSALPDPLLEDWLFRHFQRFGDISVKLSHTPELGRVAYINFRRPADARQARHAKLRPLLYDRPLRVEPVFTQQPARRPEPTPLPLTTLPAYPRSTSPRHLLLPPTLTSTTASADGYYPLYEDRTRGTTYGMSSTSTAEDEQLAPEDDHRATRNLFIGNLDHTVSEVDLRRAFDKYGPIEEVVIKRPARNQGAAYAFLKFQNLDMAHRAKLAMSGRFLGRNAMKIGYGKANPSTRLWVGGLGPNTSLAALAREFDRFGSIRTVDYVKGDSFAYIQYESLDAAQAACTQMRGFALGDRRLRVDFAKVTPEEAAAAASRYAPIQPTPYPLPLPYELLQSEYGRHRAALEPDLRVRDRTPPHLLYSDRERPFVEAGWVNSERRSAGQGTRSRSGDRGGGGGSSKNREERRRRRSLSGERGRSRADRSPERPRREPSERDPGTPPSPQHNHRPPQQDKPRIPTPEPPQPRRNHHPRPPEPPADRQSPVIEKGRTLPPVWCGHLVLKNSCFPTYLHFLEGDRDVPSALLRDRSANSGSSLAQLKIAQRLRLDQPKLEEVTRRVRQGTSGGYAVLLATQAPQNEGAVPGEPGLQRRLLRNLVSYLKQKQAAGVISLPVGGSNKGRDPSGMLYAFPPCDFHQLYQQSAQRTVGKLEENMIIVLVKDSA
ncbi:putative RNA-binding protein 15B [Pelodytes ibericus]